MTRAKAQAETAGPTQNIFAAAQPYAALWPLQGAALNTPATIDGIRRMSEVQMELAQFAAERARKNVSTMMALATCRSPAEFLEVWRKAALETVSDYTGEIANILQQPKT